MAQKMKDITNLIIDVRRGERLRFSGAASIELIHKSGQLARIRIIAATDVMFDKIKIGEDCHESQRQATGRRAHSPT
jgi:hypothetical protein